MVTYEKTASKKDERLLNPSAEEGRLCDELNVGPEREWHPDSGGGRLKTGLATNLFLSLLSLDAWIFHIVRAFCG